MSLSVGIVGLPNVGKSTLFNALTKRQQAAAENYPFCTIEPNSAIVEVSDPRLEALAKIVHPAQIIRATVEFTDIAGLVKGASKGEGLGNKFLANIRECDAILHVVRCFENDDIIHVQEGGNKAAPIDPAGDAEVIETELVLADMEQLQKRCDKTRNEAKSDPKKRPEFDAMTALLAHLGEGKPVRTFPRAEGDPILPVLRDLHFLTDKKTIYCANVAEDDLPDPTANPHVQTLKAYADANIKCQNGMLVSTTTSEMDYTDYGYSSKEEFFQATMATCKAALNGNQGDELGPGDDYGDDNGYYGDDGDDNVYCSREGAKKKIEGVDAVCKDGLWTPAILLESCVNGQKTTLGQGDDAIPLLCENGEWGVDYDAYIEMLGGESYYTDY